MIITIVTMFCIMMIAIVYHVGIVENTIILLLFVAMVLKLFVINVMVTVIMPSTVPYIRIVARKLVPKR